jgi:hypothetical protein
VTSNSGERASKVRLLTDSVTETTSLEQRLDGSSDQESAFIVLKIFSKIFAILDPSPALNGGGRPSPQSTNQMPADHFQRYGQARAPKPLNEKAQNFGAEHPRRPSRFETHQHGST